MSVLEWLTKCYQGQCTLRTAYKDISLKTITIMAELRQKEKKRAISRRRLDIPQTETLIMVKLQNGKALKYMLYSLVNLN